MRHSSYAIAPAASIVIFALACDSQLIEPTAWAIPSDVAAAGLAPVQLDEPPPWDDGIHCAGGLTPAAEELGAFLQREFPQITRVYGFDCRQNTADPNQTSQHGTGRALDLAIATRDGDADNEQGDPVANWLVSNSTQIGVQVVIWDQTIWIGNLIASKDRPYTGPIPHLDHIHVEINLQATERQTEFFLHPDDFASALR